MTNNLEDLPELFGPSLTPGVRYTQFKWKIFKSIYLLYQ